MPICFCATAGEDFVADKRVLPLVVRVPVITFEAGVRGLEAVAGDVCSVESAPVISSSASLTAAEVRRAGAARFARVDLVFVTSPSLSSLKLSIAAAAFLVCFTVGFTVAGAACLRAMGFATRVVVAFDWIFARAGRGIVASGYRRVIVWKRGVQV